MRFRFATLAAFVLLMLSSSAARAEYQYLFTDSSGNVSSNFNVTVGTTVTIQVYLAQTTGTELTTNGLNSGGVTLTYNSSIATITSSGNVAGNPAFDTSTATVATGSTKLTDAQVISPAVVAPTTGANANRILLGSFTFTGESAGSTLTVAAVPSPNNPPNYNVAGDGTVLDPMLAGVSATITVTGSAVPEPGTMALGAIGALALSGASWLRRRRSALAV